MPIVTGTEGDDTLFAPNTGGTQLDEVYGLGGNDTITATSRPFEGMRYLLDGGEGNDTINVVAGHPEASATVTILSGAGDDVLDIQNSRGTVDAGSGNDVIMIDVGARLLSGGNEPISPYMLEVTLGAGSDYVRIRDVNIKVTDSFFITDFQAGAGGDTLDLVETIDLFTNYSGANPFVTGHLQLVQVGADTVIRVDRDGPNASGAAIQNLVTLRNVTASQLTSANLNNLSLDGTSVQGVTLTGSANPDTLSGTDGDDIVDGSGGDDVLWGRFGDDRLSGGSGADRLNGGFGSDILNGDDGNDTLVDDTAGNDQLFGGAGDDLLTMSRAVDRAPGELLLEGGSGNDVLTYIASRSLGGFNGRTSDTITMRGGDGNDEFYLDGGGTYTIETGAGSDLIRFRGGNIGEWSGTVTDFTVGDGGDRLGSIYSVTQTAEGMIVSNILFRGVNAGFLTAQNTGGTLIVEFRGTANDDPLLGNNGDNNLYGFDGNDFLEGRGGRDTYDGGRGNDIYVVDNSSEIVIERLNEGVDTIYTEVSYSLAPDTHVEILSARDWSTTGALDLVGNALDNTLFGNAGGNFLDGLAGVDTLVGFGGNDTYVVDSAADIVIESAGGGTDTVFAQASYALAADAHVEVLSSRDWSSTAAIALTGNAFDNTIIGNNGDNSLYGFDGNDVLEGRGGRDTYDGGRGNDIYIVDNSSEIVIERLNEGIDTIYTEVSYSLAPDAHVEILSTRNWSATGALNLVGNALDNTLFGNAGENFLDGLTGADTLVGFGGNDTYVIDSAGDIVIESAGEGSDIIYTELSYALAGDSEVETLSTRDWSTTAAINLTGNGFANSLYGNAGANMLDGGAGNDVLVGFGGADVFAFRSALGAGNIDTITDFQGSLDRIGLGAAIFTGLAAVTASNFVTGAAAADADDRIIYNQATGALFFDPDGTGSLAAIQFASLQPGASLVATDFFLI